MKKFMRLALWIGCFMMVFWAAGAMAEGMPTAIRLNKSAATLGIDHMNRVMELSIDRASYAGGSGPIPIAVTWTADDPQMVALTPSASDPAKCTVTATAASTGTCTVTARCGDAAASCKVTVKGIFKAKSLKISGARTIKLGSDAVRNRLKLSAKIAPATASANDPFREFVNWKSLNKKVATIDEDGWIQALKPGSVRFVCSLGDGSRKKAGVTIKITKLAPTGIELKDQVLPMKRNLSLAYSIVPDNAFDQQIQWKTSNRHIASVASDGVVRGLKPGKVTITATTRTGGKKASCTLTIVESLSPTATPTPTPTASPGPTESAAPTDTPAPTPTPPPKYRVHAFGNGLYQPAAGGMQLLSAVPDAESFAALYAAASFPDGRVETKVHKNLTAAKMVSEFKAMKSAGGINSQSVTIIYFQGYTQKSATLDLHGALLGVDGGEVRISELREMLDEVPGTVFLVMDCSFSGRFLSEDTPSSGTKQALMKALAQTFQAEKYKLLCASSATGDALDTGTATSQTSLVMQGIKAGLHGARMPADADKNGLVSLTELHEYVRDSVNAFIAVMNSQSVRHYEQTVLAWPLGDRTTVYGK